MYKYTYTYTCTHTYDLHKYTYTYTLVTFSAEIVIFERCILLFPEFHKAPLFIAVSLFPDNRDTIFSHKIHLKLFSLIKKVPHPSSNRRPCTVTSSHILLLNGRF